MLPIATIYRKNYSAGQVTGLLRVSVENLLVFTCYTLELPWLNNEPGRSCIPAGITYRAQKRYSPKFQRNLYEFVDVLGRSEIKFHPVNYVSGLQGCVGLGKSLAELNDDGFLDITSSRDTIALFHLALDGHDEISVMVVSGNGGGDILRTGMHGYPALA